MQLFGNTSSIFQKSKLSTNYINCDVNYYFKTKMNLNKQNFN